MVVIAKMIFRIRKYPIKKYFFCTDELFVVEKF